MAGNTGEKGSRRKKEGGVISKREEREAPSSKAVGNKNTWGKEGRKEKNEVWGRSGSPA